MNTVSKVIYQFWTGTNPMSENRKKCLASGYQNIKVPIKLITPDKIDEYIVAGHPLHRCYKYLIPEHKSDFLRCYFMHFHGGGYADIKWYGPNNNFPDAIDLINRSPEVDIIGTQAPSFGTAFDSYRRRDVLPRILSEGYIVVRPDTKFSRLWYETFVLYLDAYSRLLELHGKKRIGYPIPYLNGMGPFQYTCEVMTRENPGSVLKCLNPERSYSISHK